MSLSIYSDDINVHVCTPRGPFGILLCWFTLLLAPQSALPFTFHEDLINKPWVQGQNGERFVNDEMELGNIKIKSFYVLVP